jgi:hypothetical protein
MDNFEIALEVISTTRDSCKLTCKLYSFKLTVEIHTPFIFKFKNT